MLKKIFFLFPAFLILITTVSAQKKKEKVPATRDTTAISTMSKASSPQKKYEEVITSKAVTRKGLFTVHKVDDKWFFEIPDSMFNRDIMAVTRYSKVAAGGSVYGGELANQQVLLFEKGPNKNVFLRVVTTVSVADSTNQIYKAVSNSNVNPIAAAFDIKTIGKDSSSVVIDVSDFFDGDNQVVNIDPFGKRSLNLMGLASDRSYIKDIQPYPINIEIKTVKTYNSTVNLGFGNAPVIISALPAAFAAGAVTLEMNTSFILLPKEPMKKRLFDPRVGYFADQYTVFSDQQQKVQDDIFIIRWRLEPKDEDMDKWKQGELVEPKKPIIYYIDPATPKQWRPYIIQGVNDWQKTFEKAGFKNAIMGKEWPDNDSTMSLEDARYSVIRYFASDIENAYGPQIHDPRSGEILESHVGWYHNVLKLLHDWYFIQASAVDPRARTMDFDDSLMGQLVRFAASHEIGHTLGLQHNMGSSSTTPVEMLRNKSWLKLHGHTPSIMDYARFNYVAQPEDSISEMELFPRIGEYDKWAIQWGYAPTYAKNEKEDQKIVNKWVIDSLKANPRLWFGTPTNPFDPRAQTEDLGDNAVKASVYGIKNLQRIITNLPEWTKEEADKYDNLEGMYTQLITQFNRYMAHVLKNVGGIYETLKSVEQPGDVYRVTPKQTQKDAVEFLNKELFATPKWLFNVNILNKISDPVSSEAVSNVQTSILNSLLSASRLNRLVICNNRFGDENTYHLDDMLHDVKKGVWSELSTKKPTDNFRRNLQKVYVESLINVLNPSTSAVNIPAGFFVLFPANVKNTDVPSVVRAHLADLRNEILAAIPLTSDIPSKYHLQDVAERIKRALNPYK